MSDQREFTFCSFDLKIELSMRRKIVSFLLIHQRSHDIPEANR
jgi:hypothetical protein